MFLELLLPVFLVELLCARPLPPPPLSLSLPPSLSRSSLSTPLSPSPPLSLPLCPPPSPAPPPGLSPAPLVLKSRLFILKVLLPLLLRLLKRKIFLELDAFESVEDLADFGLDNAINALFDGDRDNNAGIADGGDIDDLGLVGRLIDRGLLDRCSVDSVLDDVSLSNSNLHTYSSNA